MMDLRHASCLAVVSAALAITGCTEGGDLVEGSDNITINNDSSASGGGSGGGGNAGGDNGDNGGNDGGDNGGNNGGAVAGAFFDEGGFLLNQNIHPLQDNLDPTGGASPTIMPASAASCPMGTTDTGTTVVMFDDGDFFEGGDFNPEFPVCLISSDFREDGGPTVYNLTADHVYLMPNTVNVGNGGQQGLAEGSAEDVTLNIDAGVQIFARKDTDTVLRVTRGSTINVNGTIDEPVMMTAVDANADAITGDPTDMTGRGDWGGLVLAGYATIESPTGEDQSEAAPDTDIDVFFGGNNDADSSGSVNYLIIGESGFTFGANEEVQGLTVEGVGSGTTLTNIQIFGSDDDGVEFFGGTASISNLVINAQTDDALDLDQGYRGTIKNVIVRMGSLIGNSAHEGDGNIGTTFDDAPITRPIIANGLLLGAGLTDSLAVRMREGYGADFENVVVADANVVDTISSGAYGVGCFTNENEVDEDLNALNVAFFCANGTTPSGAADVANNLYNVWAMGMFDEDGDGTGDGTVTFMAAEDQNISVDGGTYEVTTPGFTPDFSLTSAADDYMGAVDPNATPFWQGWTVNLANSN